jgi:hypothetical protein
MRFVLPALCLALGACSAASAPAKQDPELDKIFGSRWVSAGTNLYVDPDEIWPVGDSRKKADVAVVTPAGRSLQRVVVDCSTRRVVDVAASIGDPSDAVAEAVAPLCDRDLKHAPTVALPAHA